MVNIHDAARDGDVKKLKEVIVDIFDDIVDTDGRRAALGNKDASQLTPLHYAVKYNNIDAVKILYENGADINVLGKDGQTPLHFATKYMKSDDDISLIQFLIYSGANVNTQDDSKSTPLHFACSSGNERVVKELLKSKDISCDVQDSLEATPLHHACANGNLSIIDMLLEKGVDLLAEDEANMTPLHTACSQGHLELVEHLFTLIEGKHGINAVTKIIEQQNIEGQAPIHLTVLGSHLSVTKCLLERGADVNTLMDGQESCLHAASVTGNREIVKLVLSHGSILDQKNDCGRTPLHKAARFGKHKVVDMLIKSGADVNARDDQLSTPLILASSGSGNSRTIQYLLRNGAEIQLDDKEDQTALHVAAQENFIKGVKVLINSEHGSSIVNKKDKENNTALHIACMKGFEEIAIMLLEKDADVQSRNVEAKTPLHLAAFYGQDDVVDNILEKNASTINDFDNGGNSPLHLAAMEGQNDVIKYLLKCGAAVNDKNVECYTPLDCAAKNGKTQAVKTLLWGGASTEPSTEQGWGPLHLSCIEGHAETVSELLKHCAINEVDANGRNPLDLAIDNRNKDAGEAILGHRDWKSALRNKTLEDGKVTTPVRKMIQRMPELATYTFDRCIEENPDYPQDDDRYDITLDYEFLDDVYNDWPCDFVRKDVEELKEEGRGKGELFTQEKLQKEMEKKETHTFSYMIHYQRKELLSHPLCLSMIERKWQQFAAYLYYFKLILYTVFLTFITGYSMVSAPLREPYRAEDCRIIVESKTWDMLIFVHIGKYVVLILALIHIMFEEKGTSQDVDVKNQLMQLIGQRLDYFALDNLLEWTVYLLAIANVADDFIEIPFLGNGLVCGKWQKSSAAICIFLAWFNFILFIRKFPIIGIYIVMLLYVIQTFFQFFVVFIFLILAFGFSFYVLLHDEKSIPSFDNPIPALVKTGVMMTGELNFDDFFFADHKPLLVTWLLFILFILIMVIVLMNLLVGLAVDDIQAVQKEAEMTKATMQEKGTPQDVDVKNLIDICLDSEKTLPKMIRNKFVKKQQQVYPNVPGGVPLNITKEVLADLRQIVQSDPEPMNQLQDEIKVVHTDLGKMNNRLEEMDEQLTDLQNLHQKLDNITKMVNSVMEHQQRRKKARPKKPKDDTTLKTTTKPTEEAMKSTDEDLEATGGDDEGEE